ARDVFLDVVGQPLGAFADGAIVDGVGANRIHSPAPPAGAEGDDGPKSVVERLPFLLAEVLRHLERVQGVTRLGEPFANILDRAGRQLRLPGSLVELRKGGGQIKRR